MPSRPEPVRRPEGPSGSPPLAAVPRSDGRPTSLPAPASEAARGADWFDALFRAHAPAVHRYLHRRGAGDDTDDLTADVLVVAWRRRATVPEGLELAWLYRTAGFVLANHRRKARPVPVDELPDQPDPADPALLAIRDEQVRETVGRLGARDRQVLLLAAWEGMGGAELAAVLGVSRGGADAALSRARARLRATWDDAPV